MSLHLDALAGFILRLSLPCINKFGEYPLAPRSTLHAGPLPGVRAAFRLILCCAKGYSPNL